MTQDTQHIFGKQDYYLVGETRHPKNENHELKVKFACLFFMKDLEYEA